MKRRPLVHHSITNNNANAKNMGNQQPTNPTPPPNPFGQSNTSANPFATLNQPPLNPNSNPFSQPQPNTQPTPPPVNTTPNSANPFSQSGNSGFGKNLPSNKIYCFKWQLHIQFQIQFQTPILKNQ